MASNSSEIDQVTPPNGLLDHDANAEATGGDECLEGMELAVYNAAKTGITDDLSAYKERLHQILTPTRNTVLHIYIACAVSTDQKEVSDIVVDEILKMCPPLLLQSNENGDTALHIAARYGRTAIVNTIKQAGSRNRDGGGAWPIIISTTNKEGNTALHEAVRFNHFDVVKMLTTQDDHQQTFYSANVDGETPLYMAAERGYRDVVFQILHSCNDVPAYYQGPNGRTAIHAAVIRKDEGMTKKLLERTRVLTKAVDEKGCTPLHLAASLGHTSIVKLLLEHDRSAAYIRDNEKRTAFHHAAWGGHKDVMRQLIAHCPDCCELVDYKGRNVLHCGIMAGKEFQVMNCVLEDPWLCNILLNGKDDNGDTPLHHLADTSSIRFNSFGFGSDVRVDKMAFNKANQNALDILLQSKGDSYSSTTQGELKDTLKRNGVMPGCRIVRNQEVEVENTVKKTLGAEEKYKKIKDSHLVVATLIATVSFAAGFTMPGGYRSDKGSDQGLAILARSTAFQAFVITNTIAMTLSSSSVLLHLHSIWFLKRDVFSEAAAFCYNLTMLALIAMVIAFITGTYAVLGDSSRLGTTICVLGFVLFFGVVEFVVYDERGLSKLHEPLVLSLLLYPFFWLPIKMFFLIRKLFYQCLRLVSLASKGKRSKHMFANHSSSLPR